MHGVFASGQKQTLLALNLETMPIPDAISQTSRPGLHLTHEHARQWLDMKWSLITIAEDRVSCFASPLAVRPIAPSSFDHLLMTTGMHERKQR